MKVWGHTEKRQTLMYQRLSLFSWNIVYAAFYANRANP